MYKLDANIYRKIYIGYIIIITTIVIESTRLLFIEIFRRTLFSLRCGYLPYQYNESTA
jgi:hypothetical protein